MKRIVCATLGNCIHVMGLYHFMELADSLGYKTEFLGQGLTIPQIVDFCLKEKPDIVALSYRLTPESAEQMFRELKEAREKHNLKSIFIFGGTTSVAEKAKLSGAFDRVFSTESTMDIVAYLKGIQIKSERSAIAQTLPERIERCYPYPLVRHHFGRPTMKETLEGARKIAESGVLDILSIGPDQNAQEFFFRPEFMNHALDGAGGVPLRKPEDLSEIYRATRCGNFPLVRCYSGTNDLDKWAIMLKERINNAWGAIPICWYSELDGRSKRKLRDAIRENIEVIRWHAQNGVPVEVNESHQWALRYCSDVIEVATAYIATYIAKSAGVKYYVMQYMFNTPPGISPKMDLAKMLAKIEMVEELQDENFRIYRMVRTGLASLSADFNVAKGQMASSIFFAMSIKPHIVHVVGYSEGDHAATADEVIESCKIARGAIENALLGLPDFACDREVQERKRKIKSECSVLLDAIKNLGDGSDASLANPDVIFKAIKIGLLDAPQLRGRPCAKGKDVTRIINGACLSVDPETGEPIDERERIRRVQEEEK
ncbi:MAG: cobalamin B12-binding domain-containing protein [Thermoplasmatales archaeon]|nr:cobalamin B12-binding domain-containing protein [Thermoplasmatales archaeon]